MYTPRNLNKGLGDFGSLLTPIVVVTSVANMAVGVRHATKVGKIQRRFAAKLESNEEKKQYVQYMAQQLQSKGLRLAKGGRFRPGTEVFELVLKKAMKDEMHYKGNCNVVLFDPYKESPDAPRKVFAKISKNGFVEAGAQVPNDVGPLWAAKCKAAQKSPNPLFKFLGVYIYLYSTLYLVWEPAF